MSSWVCPIDFDGRKKCRVCRSKPLWFKELNIIHDGNKYVERRASSSGSVYKISGEAARIVSECFVNGNIVTHFNLFLCPFEKRDMSVMPKCQILFFNFDLLHTVRSS